MYSGNIPYIPGTRETRRLAKLDTE
jgi:hypothetical protein